MGFHVPSEYFVGRNNFTLDAHAVGMLCAKMMDVCPIQAQNVPMER